MRYKAVAHLRGEQVDLTEPRKCIEDVLKSLYNATTQGTGTLVYDESVDVVVKRKPAGVPNYRRDGVTRKSNWTEVELSPLSAGGRC